MRLKAHMHHDEKPYLVTLFVGSSDVLAVTYVPADKCTIRIILIISILNVVSTCAQVVLSTGTLTLMSAGQGNQGDSC
jgi:hypothetical protein